MFYRFLMLAFLFLPGLALAHKLAPVSLKIEQIDNRTYLVEQKYPALGALKSLPDIHWASDCVKGNLQQDRSGSAVIDRYKLECRAQVAGLHISGFQANKNALLLDFKEINGVWKRELVTTEIHLNLGEPIGMAGWISRFVSQGFSHVIEGLDHVLFLLLLPLLFSRLRQLFWAATLFSFCHALSVFSVALTGTFVPSQIIEPLIAASIFILAWQVQSTKLSSSSKTCPKDFCMVGLWGVVHGIGFASQTAAYGFEVEEWLSWLYLLAFNFGVEIAQLCLAMVGFFLYLRMRKYRKILIGISTYFAGTVSVCWCLQRLFI